MVSIQIKEAELLKAAKKINALGTAVSRRQRKAMLRKGALIIRDAARANVPVADEPTKRYNTPKLDGKLKAPKGQGVVVQEYDPGTLRDDINVKSLRRTADLFVGPGTGSRITAYWAHWIEFGTADIRPVGYMRRAVRENKEAAIDQIITDAKKLYERTIKKLAKQ